MEIFQDQNQRIASTGTTNAAAETTIKTPR